MTNTTSPWRKSGCWGEGVSSGSGVRGDDVIRDLQLWAVFRAFVKSFCFTLQGTGGLEQRSDMVLPYPSGVVLPAVFQQTEPRCLLGGTRGRKPEDS